MKAIKLRNYSKAVAVKDANGIETGETRRQPVWVYGLAGKQEELDAYKRIQESAGVNYHEDEDTGMPLYFAPQFHGQSCTVAISKNPTTGVERVYVDDSEQQEMLSVADGLGDGAVAKEFAKLTASKLFGDLFGSGADTPRASTASAEETAEEPAEADPADADIDEA